MSDTSKKTQEHLRESLSALMDGEANELELHRVLDQLETSHELRETALGYQRIGEAIRHEHNAFSGVDLSSSISAALADEPAPAVEIDKAPAAANNSSWFANLGRLAIAASVAFATVVGVQSWNQSEQGVSGAEVAQVSVADPVPVQNQFSNPSSMLPSADMFGARGVQAGFGTHQPGLTPEQMSQARGYAQQLAQKRFRAYMLEHAEQVGAQGGLGVVPFVRASSFGNLPQFDSE